MRARARVNKSDLAGLSFHSQICVSISLWMSRETEIKNSYSNQNLMYTQLNASDHRNNHNNNTQCECIQSVNYYMLLINRNCNLKKKNANWTSQFPRICYLWFWALYCCCISTNHRSLMFIIDTFCFHWIWFNDQNLFWISTLSIVCNDCITKGVVLKSVHLYYVAVDFSFFFFWVFLTCKFS